MELKTKAAILYDTIRKFASGGKDIMPNDWRAFVEAQNDGYQTGPENDSGGRDPTGSQEDGLAHTDCDEIVHELARPSKKVWR